MKYKIVKLSEAIFSVFKNKSIGHCLRINDLPEQECYELCENLSNNEDFKSYVIISNSPDQEKAQKDFLISLDTAIELRNKKANSLCLIFPPGIDVPASLSNTFEVYDIFNFLRNFEEELLQKFNEDVYFLTKRILQQAKYGVLGRDLKSEDVIDFLESVLDAPDVQSIGNSLWKVGLIPDNSDSFMDRLKLNYNCVRDIAKPSKPQLTIRQRLENTKLRKGKFLDELEEFLINYPLYPAKLWLKAISTNEEFSFDHWEFPEIEKSNLEEIKLKKPKRSTSGKLVAACGNLNCDSDDDPISAECGPGKKINVTWETVPKDPINVGGWLIELIPSREDYDENELESDLPQAVSKQNIKRAKINLDIDLDDIQTKWVQVRISALDENENTIVDNENNPIEALSERILLQKDVVDSIDKKPKQFSYPNFPIGFLNLVMNYKGEAEDWNTSPQGWMVDEDLNYFKVQVNDAQVCRVAVSNVIKEIEIKVINNPEINGRFYYDVIDIDQFNIDELVSLKLFSDDYNNLPIVQTFLNKRKDIFSKIRNIYGTTGVIEVITNWDELLTKAKNYAESYAQLLDAIINSENLPENNRKELLYQALTIDSLELNIKYNTGNQGAMLLLPTHPQRLLWFASYSILLKSWFDQLLGFNSHSRKKAIDFDLLSQIQASNIPFILPCYDLTKRDEWFIFIKNINFFIALLLPVNCNDWARVSADIVNFLGYDETYTVNEIKSNQIKEIFNEYLKVDQNVKSRGINLGIVNPGSGELIASALNSLLFNNGNPDNDGLPIKRINIASIANAPLPIEISSFERLKQEFYYSEGITENSSALYPALTYLLSEKSEKPEFPNGNQNITVHNNVIKPTIDTYKKDGGEEFEEIGLYGLINRWMTKRVSDRGIYQTIYWIPVSKAARFERHPVDGALTDYQLTLMRVISTSLSYLITGVKEQNTVCSLKSIIGPDEKGFIEYLHQQSDWVITIDRFLGPELFDSPIDNNISNLSEKYLIDYTPSFSEGIGERLLLSTCWIDQVCSNIFKFFIDNISKLGNCDIETMVNNILKAIKLYSGNLFFRMFDLNDDLRKAIAIALIINNLKEKQQLENSFILPIWENELFPDQLCEFVIVQAVSDKLVFDCTSVNFLSLEDNESIYDKLNNTEKYLENIFIEDENKVGSVLERSNLVTQLRYYFRKAIRYGLIKDEVKILKFRELMSKLENGKSVHQVKQKIFNVDLTSLNEQEIIEKVNDVDIETHSAKSLNLFCSESPIDSAEVLEGSMKELTVENISDSENKLEPNSAQSVNETIGKDILENFVNAEYPSVAKIILGTANNQTIHFEPSTKGSPHAVIIGIPGQGKTVTINSLLVQLNNQGVGAIVFDFHGQFSSPSNPFNKYCSPEIWDVLNDKLPFNPFEIDNIDEHQNFDFYIKMQSAEIADIFEYVCELGTIQRYALYEAIFSLYKNRRNSTENLNIKIEDLKKKLKQLEKDNNVRNVLARSSKLLEMNFFADNIKWDVLESTKKGLVLNLKSLGEGTIQNAVSAFVLRKLYKEILKWDESDKLKLVIVLDEAHRLSKDITLPLIMQEARKFGVMIVIASQNINHFHPNVIGNAGTKILYRTNAPASNSVGQLLNMRTGKDPRRIVENLRVGNAIVQTPEMKYGEIVQMKMIE